MNLNNPVENLAFVGPIYARRLGKLDIFTIGDLIYHIPSRFLDFRESASISSLRQGDIVNVEGEIASFKNQYTKSGKKLQLAEISDPTGSISVIWFNQMYLSRTIKKGNRISLSGKVDWFGRALALISPEYEILREGVDPIHTKGLVPVYPETFGVSSKWLRRRIADAISKIEINEYLPKEILEKYKLISFNKAVVFVHSPKNPQQFDEGRRRLAFNELLLQHLKNSKRKGEWRQNKVKNILKVDSKKIKSFTEGLPFKLTQSQIKAVDEILSDLRGETPMNRLLEGDVGSGKTVVAAIGAFAAFLNGYQTVFMAPTQILAQQHATTLEKLFKKFKARISLITSEKKDTGFGKSDIYVGTHALIHRNIDLKDVSLVVIDEQHRFGVEQRQHLVNKIGKKRFAPHVLTMTATPIPRTVALTLYGDLSLTTLDELPAGRKPVTTWIVPQQKREAAYSWIEKEIETKNIQVFVICPLIEESENFSQVKAVTTEAENLKKLLPKRKIEILHGRQKHEVKNKILKKFKEGKIDILVATPVVEVGIDVPSATIMVIEGAERFGLASLHQLRGRVGRGSEKSYCLAITESKSKKVIARLSALRRSLSGFELAELDLKMRGPGEVLGLRQHGFPEFKVAKWTDTDLIKETRELAQEVSKNPEKFEELNRILNNKEVAPN